MKRNTDLDFTKIIKLISSFVAQTTCMNCCKFLELPETAECGHTACHACWQHRCSCRWCAATIDHHALKQNITIQILTNHVQNMCKVFELTFDFKVDKFSIGHIKNLQKHGSALDNESIYEITMVKHVKSTAQVHSHTCSQKTILSPNVVVKQVSQVDWEAIEQMPEICQFNEPHLEFDPDSTKPIKRCLRRSERLFSILKLSAESADVTYPAENLQSPIQINHKNIKTESPFTDVVSNQNVISDWDLIEKFSDIDELNVEQVIKSGTEHTKYVTDWLANSDSYLKESICSELQEIKAVTSTIQIDSDNTTKKILGSPKIANKDVPQDDWYKIENLSDVDEFPEQQTNCESDSTKNITNWLANSKKYSTSEIFSKSIQSNRNTKFKKVPQDDWDKIYQLSNNDNKQSKVVGDINDTNEYSTEKPRRSSRKREFKYYAECHYYPLNIKRRRS